MTKLPTTYEEARSILLQIKPKPTDKPAQNRPGVPPLSLEMAAKAKKDAYQHLVRVVTYMKTMGDPGFREADVFTMHPIDDAVREYRQACLSLIRTRAINKRHEAWDEYEANQKALFSWQQSWDKIADKTGPLPSLDKPASQP